MIQMNEPATVSRELSDLRKAILADPYFKGVPSLNPLARKTALFFHAKDDLPEIRREVFKLIASFNIKFFSVIKSMDSVVEYVKSRNVMDSSYRYKPNELYDLTVRMLFKTRLHKNQAYQVTFAKRGKKDRTAALKEQLYVTRERFISRSGLEVGSASLEVIPEYPWDCPCLQVTDYCLWALQRFIERGEDRYIETIREKISFIHDVDDKSKNEYGTYYHRANQLTMDAIKNRQV